MPKITTGTPPLDAVLARAGMLERAAGVTLLARALVPGARSVPPRLAETLARLHEQLRLNRGDPRVWSEAQKRRIFDPDWLVRRCAGDAALAAAAHHAWRDAAARLHAAGEDVAGLAWAALAGAAASGRERGRLSGAG